jgi:hypothetical protein
MDTSVVAEAVAWIWNGNFSVFGLIVSDIRGKNLIFFVGLWHWQC